MQSAAKMRLKRDSTEHKRVDAVRTQLAAIVESSNDAIFSRSLDGIILSWNGGAEARVRSFVITKSVVFYISSWPDP